MSFPGGVSEDSVSCLIEFLGPEAPGAKGGDPRCQASLGATAAQFKHKQLEACFCTFRSSAREFLAVPKCARGGQTQKKAGISNMLSLYNPFIIPSGAWAPNIPETKTGLPVQAPLQRPRPGNILETGARGTRVRPGPRCARGDGIPRTRVYRVPLKSSH